MIVHRPGCMLLNSFLEELSHILAEKGINIKMANITYRQTGLCSYLQTNIADCDFVLIMITDGYEGLENLNLFIYLYIYIL